MKCCICGKEIRNLGNNPSPLKNAEGEYFDYEERCCDDCNNIYVIPVRLAMMTNNQQVANEIQNQVDRLLGVKKKVLKRLFVKIERPDGSTYEQEIEYLNNSVKDSVKNAQALLGNPYYFTKDSSGKKVKRLKSNAYLIVDNWFVMEEK